MVAALPVETPTLVTTYLHMTKRAQFRPAYITVSGFGNGFDIQQMEAPDVPFYRFLYSSVGEMWHWRERNLLSDDKLHEILTRAQVYVLFAGGMPAGYVELEAQDESTEITYFGLRPQFHGRGLGKHLLSHGIAQAWAGGAKRVWLHTCSLDGPYALDNYQKRGFMIYDVHREPMPELFL
ncbi:MAG TPA: GNAT family N-acetyltransferase [Phototrophicaceae bacterium]|jgi:ribosomal protein S18 acetylase RimI-like enzyme|nr:GNAT family N-acetyltransferase [Phototrophicaceae bacterium]